MHLSKKGFTLVELLIAISIVAILSGILIGSINIPKQMAKSRDVVRREELAIIAGSLERYYADNNQYVPRSSYGAANTVLTVLEPDYIRDIPLDPNDVAYQYRSFSGNQDFCLCAQMEDFDAGESEVGTCAPPSGYNFCLQNAF